MEAKQSASGDSGLMIGGVHDPAEKAADQMADRVMRMAATGPVVRRKCRGCEEDEKVQRAPIETGDEGTVLTKSAPNSTPVAGGSTVVPASPGATTAIKTMGTGKPLAAVERAFFEPRFGADLSSVRVHDGPAADEATRTVNARAFTIGNDIAFAKGENQPRTETGRHLMAHELAHVGQQRTHGRISLQRDDKQGKDDKCMDYMKKKREAFKRKFPFNTWGNGILTQSDATKFIEALPEKEGGVQIFKGSKAKYATVVNEINIRRGILSKRQCMAYPIGWVDPNIGSIKKEVTSLNKKGAKARKDDVIATIYAEQSHSNKKNIDINSLLDKQREYIYYAMLLRIELPGFGAKLQDIVTGGAFHGKKPTSKSGTYQRNYVPAMEYLKKGSTKKPLNVAIIKKLQALVGDRNVNLPADAGSFYFHWEPKETPTAETEYARVKKRELKIGTRKVAASAIAEKRGAFKQAKEKVKATMQGVTKDTGWLTKIAGRNKGKDNERVGSMYIYK